ncbi:MULTISPECIES: sulfurtransferase complex subunit TusB [unclassified Pseudomonas]|uniref:sulfurtransferase complex subunit TusB n=1 Tax=unclassified Pseudomonas TaxID=196821 RepID=UPI0021C9056A|nr:MULTISPECIES: sulfurtransferase complex subunit TusB [unclassified Pseudomonas]MCU1731783.1 sulfurtransferase complex subunit TusB [Pseudomonas sp. 20P_3.2_Bac4]MCU1743839.1 sulfurtransferase complex subunit TusB [Pseudomonas sp. 20P_3.2_Bac5]
MSTLHVISHSPFSDNRLYSCLRLLGPHDGLLLCGDAVYALQPGSAPLAGLRTLGPRLYVLEEDLQARAITESPATAVDYPGFVALSLNYDKVNSWL